MSKTSMQNTLNVCCLSFFLKQLDCDWIWIGLSIHFKKWIWIWILNQIFVMDLDWIEQKPACNQTTITKFIKAMSESVKFNRVKDANCLQPQFYKVYT